MKRGPLRPWMLGSLGEWAEYPGLALERIASDECRAPDLDNLLICMFGDQHALTARVTRCQQPLSVAKVSIDLAIVLEPQNGYRHFTR